MDIFNNYSFQIILIGTVLIGILTSLVGTINVYKKQSLIGDALGHSTYAGIVIAFMLTRRRSTLVLLIGAIISAAISYFLIEYANKNSKIPKDSNMAIFLSGFFGLGLFLKTHIQGNPNYMEATQAGLDNYIFGEAAYLLKSDIKIIFLVLLIVLLIIVYNYKDIKYYLFDREFSMMVGVNNKKIDYLCLFMTILVIGIGIKAVGIILISSFLIMPTISASKWSDKFINVMILSVIFSSISASIGSFISTNYNGFSTGPTIIIISGIIAIISIIFGKFGIIKRRVK